jgi:hypothetical protein
MATASSSGPKPKQWHVPDEREDGEARQLSLCLVYTVRHED